MKPKLIKTVLIGVVGAAFSCGIIAFLFYNGYMRFNYPSFKEFPVRGIDISHHQGNINWGKLKDENISFIFIKATEGADFKDPEFKNNWDNAKKYGYAVGGYHFYRLCKTGLEQADNFIQTVPKEHGSLPPAIDLEFGGNCKTNKSRDLVIKEIGECIATITKHYGKTPVIYATKDFYKDYLINNFSQCPVWIRDISSRPLLPDNKGWIFWQFANRGHLNGINGFIDLNVFYGDRNEFKKILNPD